MKFVVDNRQRYAKMRAHTATHLLHAELAKILPHTKQAGSMVDEDILRFDFQADKPLTVEQITDIEKTINNLIYKALPVENVEMSYDQAIESGAKAFFEDKYGDTVRVVSVKDGEDKLSVELCGWTHVINTKDIGCFAITGQEAVASGIKRMVAVTGPKVFEQIQEKDNSLRELSDKLDVPTKQLPNKVDKLLKEYKELEEKYTSMQDKMLGGTLAKLFETANGDDNFDKIVKIPAELESVNFKNIVNQAKSMDLSGVVMLYNAQGNFAILNFDSSKSARDISTNLGLKWGGNENTVQGRDPKVLELFN